MEVGKGMIMELYNKLLSKEEKLAVVGLGYVGLPIAVEFSKKITTIGFDINKDKIESYINGEDPTKEVGSVNIKKSNVYFTWREESLQEAKFIIVAVPTPINSDKTPDLAPVINACHLIGRNIKKGSVIVFESTVYPGVTEDICAPILEKESGLLCGQDFKIGYSPERINPGDKIHTIKNIVKIVSGMDYETRELIGKVYELIIDTGVYPTESIKVAEAAKLVENAQRDINIAFMNELAMVFEKMGIRTKEVVNAMNTKWNALNFTPGLVGGHCIGVDPYYFVYQAERLGYHSQIILAGRKINDDMGNFIADITIKQLIKSNILVQQANVYILGITFKENCPDIRNSKVEDIIGRLKEYGVSVKIVDNVADKNEVKKVYNVETIKLDDVKDADCIIFAVSHSEFLGFKMEDINKMFKNSPNHEKVIIDVKSILDSKELLREGYLYWSL